MSAHEYLFGFGLLIMAASFAGWLVSLAVESYRGSLHPDAIGLVLLAAAAIARWIGH